MPALADINAVTIRLSTSDDIRKQSVVDVDNTTLHKRVATLPGSLYDTRLGTTVPTAPCATCGQLTEKCPGHRGSIKLSQPVYNAEMLGSAARLLSCICVHCSACLVTKNHPKYEWLLGLTGEHRLRAIYKYALKIRKCGQLEIEKDRNEGDDENLHIPIKTVMEKGYCGRQQPLRFEKYDLLIRPIMELSELPASPEDLPVFTNQDAFDMLSDVTPEVSEFLSFGTRLVPTIGGMMWSHIMVPSILTRPSGRNQCDDDLTMRLRCIVKANTPATDLSMLKVSNRCLYNNVCAFTIPGSDDVVLDGSVFFDEDDVELNIDGNISKNRLQRKRRRGQVSRHLQGRLEVIPPHLDDLFSLQRQCAGYQNSKLVTKLDRDFGRELLCIRDRFSNSKGSRGRLRGCVFGKRGDMNGRGVLSCDTHQDVDEVGLPIDHAMKLSMQERVTVFNWKKLVALVDNGPHRYPGATYIERDGQKYAIEFMHNPQIQLKDIIHRHILTGDIILVNRQPSLHRYSLMAYRVRVHKHHTIKIHLAVTKPLGADFDGDEANVFLLQSLAAQAEARTIMAVSENMVKDGKMLVCFVQHSVIGAYKMSRCVNITREQLWNLAVISGDEVIFEGLRNLGKHKNVSGWDVLQCLFDRMDYDDDRREVITRKVLNTWLLHYWFTYGGKLVVRRMSGITRVLEGFLSIVTCSISFANCVQEIDTDVLQTITHAIEKVDAIQFNKSNYITESMICKVLNEIRRRAGDSALEQIKTQVGRNGLYDLVTSGAKGSTSNIVQNVAMVGQQFNSRCERQLPLAHCVGSSLRRGFVRSSFVDGLNAQEFFHHLAGSRDGLIDTSVSTAETGYTARKIGKATEDLIAGFDGSVRDIYGNLFDEAYGGDTWNNDGLFTMPAVLLTTPLRILYNDLQGLPQCERDRLLDVRSRLLPVVIHGANTISTCTTVVTPIPFGILLKQFTRDQKGCQRVRRYTCSQDQVVELVHSCWERYCKRTNCRFEALFLWEMRSTVLLAAIGSELDDIIGYIRLVSSRLERAVVEVGLPIGMRCADGFTEPLTQLQLDSFHEAGKESQLATGVPRVKELINCSPTSTPSMYIVFKNPLPVRELVQVTFVSVVSHWTLLSDDIYESDDIHHAVQHCRQVLTGGSGGDLGVRRMTIIIHLRKPMARKLCAVLCERSISMGTHFASLAMSVRLDLRPNGRQDWFGLDVYTSSCFYNFVTGSMPVAHITSDEMVAMVMYERLLASCRKIVIQGIPELLDFVDMSATDQRRKSLIVNEDGDIAQHTNHVMITRGDNTRAIFARSDVDISKTRTNDIAHIYQYFGICAARNAIEFELNAVMTSASATVAKRHIDLIASVICFTGEPCGFSFSGFLTAGTSPLKVATFERVVDGFVRIARAAHHDTLEGVSESCLFGIKIKQGTGNRQTQLVNISGARPIHTNRYRDPHGVRNTFAGDMLKSLVGVLPLHNGPLKSLSTILFEKQQSMSTNAHGKRNIKAKHPLKKRKRSKKLSTTTQTNMVEPIYTKPVVPKLVYNARQPVKRARQVRRSRDIRKKNTV